MAKKNDPFKSLGNIALGTAGLGLTLGIGSAVASKASTSGGTNLGGAFTTVASFAPIAVTGLAGHTVLKTLKQKKSKKGFGIYK